MRNLTTAPDRNMARPVPAVPVQQIRARRQVIPLFLLLLLLTTALRVDGAVVTVPIELDYPLLQRLLVRQFFDSPGHSTEVLNDPSGCSEIVLAEPQLSENRSHLQIVAKVKARLGVGVAGGCTSLLLWDGSAGLVGRPVIQPGARSVSMKVQDSWLEAEDGRRITSGRIWELAKSHIHPMLNRFTVDLAPSINAVGRILPEVLPRHSRQQLKAIVASLKLKDIEVSPTGLDVLLSLQVEEPMRQPSPEAPLSDQELQQWETRWQMMDALFTFAVKYYVSATDLDELQGTLLEILLDSRYRLRDAVTAPVSRTNDPVRSWFLDSWQRLRPVIRRVSLEQTGQEPLLWISLLTATDALYALDRLGPAINLDISADGLRRLARLVNAQTDMDPLHYNQAVDPALQRLFRLWSAPEPEQPLSIHFNPWPVRTAWARASADRLHRWAPGKDQLSEYLPLVADLLNDTTEDTLKKSKLDPPVARLFRKLVLATAWQESCWRQYVVNRKTIEPLRSGTGDVGLMQINERVWRGFYDIQKLRWDIAYNSRAGTEVLLNYLVKYALKRGEQKQPGGLDNLARASYSAYNGGPSQVSRYRNPRVASTHKKVDTAFWKKYQQVKAGNEMNVAQCLGGEAAAAGKTRRKTTVLKKTPVKTKEKAAAGAALADPDERWVLAQAQDRFTLQLAVFSQRQSARKFIAQQSLTRRARIYPVRKGKTRQYAVLYGSYKTRAEANRAKESLKQLKPWVRQFRGVRKAQKP